MVQKGKEREREWKGEKRIRGICRSLTHCLLFDSLTQELNFDVKQWMLCLSTWPFREADRSCKISVINNLDVCAKIRDYLWKKISISFLLCNPLLPIV